MKKKTAMLALAAAMMIGGCGDSAQPQENPGTSAQTTEGAQAEEDPAQAPVRAVYLKNDYGELFINIEQDNPFTGTIPEEIVDEEGNALSEEDLKSGDVLEVYGNGIMLESYPGQYPGITKLVRVEQENKEYQEKYQAMLDQFCPAPDLSQPPELSVNYRTEDAVVTAACDRFGYSWQYDGNEVKADALHVLQASELVQQTVDGDTQMTLLFTYEPQEIQVTRWESVLKSESLSEIPEGEEIAVSEGEEGSVIPVQPGYVYQISAHWQEGHVTYGFEVINKE